MGNTFASLSIFTLLTALLAGCNQPASTSLADVPDQTSAAYSLVYHIEGYTELAVFAGLPAPGSQGGPVLRFNTTENLTAVVLEVAWNDTVQDLDAALSADVNGICFDPPNCVHPLSSLSGTAYTSFGDFYNQNGTVGDPDSPSRIVVKGLALQDVLDECASPCEWGAGALTKGKGPWVQVSWNLWVTVFYNEEPPSSYTAVPWL